MDNATIALTPLDLCIGALLVVVAGAVSMGMGLRLERSLLLASIRTVIQLLAIGYVLRWIFAMEHWFGVLALTLFMLYVAGRAAVKRSGRRYKSSITDAFLTLTIVGYLTLFLVTAVIIGSEPWYAPRYAIPILGMILGNSLNGISLCLDTMLEHFDDHADIIENDLALGASRWEAAQPVLQESVRKGMIPIINSMMVVGLVSLPGMMTGQIIAGNDPLQAVQYQIIVMFMIAAATSLGCIGTAYIGYRRLFDECHRLRRERITRIKSTGYTH